MQSTRAKPLEGPGSGRTRWESHSPSSIEIQERRASQNSEAVALLFLHCLTTEAPLKPRDGWRLPTLKECCRSGSSAVSRTLAPFWNGIGMGMTFQLCNCPGASDIGSPQEYPMCWPVPSGGEHSMPPGGGEMPDPQIGFAASMRRMRQRPAPSVYACIGRTLRL